MANTVDKVLSVAKSEVGYLEKSASAYKKNPNVLYSKTEGAGSDNYTKYGKTMHEVYPAVMDFPAAWCDCFVDWCFYTAYGISNAKSLLGGDFNDYTVASAQLYKNKGAWHTSSPQVGDQIFFTNGTRICHTGLVYKVDSTYVYTYEGNTSGASALVSNGGGVCAKKYALGYSKIAGYGRPKYDVETTTSTTTSTAWSGSKVASAQSFDKSIAGTYKVTASVLNMRYGAGTGCDIVRTLSNGTKVQCYGYYTAVSGTKWYLVQVSGTTVTGYCSSKYLTR